MKPYFPALLVLATLLSACGPVVPAPPFEVAATCQAQGMSFQLERAQPCAFFEALAEDAVQELVVRRGFMPEEELRRAMVGLDVFVHDRPRSIGCAGMPAVEETQGATITMGCYVVGGDRIETNGSGGPLAHELIHRWRHVVQGAEDGDLQHAGWSEHGAPAGAQDLGLNGYHYLVGSWADATAQWRYDWSWWFTRYEAGEPWGRQPVGPLAALP